MKKYGIDIEVKQECEVCIKAKGTTKPFSKKGDRVETGKVFSYDIVGPMECTGIYGKRYGLVMVHHESNATFVEPIVAKVGIGNDSLSYRLSRLDQLRRLADSHLNK
jgi:hypothetical protein